MHNTRDFPSIPCIERRNHSGANAVHLRGPNGFPRISMLISGLCLLREYLIGRKRFGIPHGALASESIVRSIPLVSQTQYHRNPFPGHYRVTQTSQSTIKCCSLHYGTQLAFRFISFSAYLFVYLINRFRSTNPPSAPPCPWFRLKV